jgi:hypothetical protein
MSDWIRREAESYKAAQRVGVQQAEQQKRRDEALANAWPMFWNTVVGHIEGDVTAWNKAFSEEPQLHLHTERIEDTKLRIRDSDGGRRILLVATTSGIAGTTMRHDPNGNEREIGLPMLEWIFDGNRISGVKSDKGALAAPAVSELIVRMFLPKT